jgi:putative DNA primase/helicase
MITDLMASAEQEDYIQQAFGYSLTGSTAEKAFFFCCGPSGTGKTTLLNAIRVVFVEYSTTIQIDSLMTRVGEGMNSNIQADLADLRGARFVQTSETERGQQMQEGRVKRITQGTGVIKATRKYENPIQFLETHKIWFDANEKPPIASGVGIWERMHLIPFSRKIPEELQDRGIHEKLQQEKEGIARWVVEGALTYLQAGRLIRPPSVREAVNEYRESQDDLGAFLDEHCVLGEGLKAQAGPLYESYRFSCLNWRTPPFTKHEFKAKLAERGIGHKEMNKANYYLGLALKGQGAQSFGEPNKA